MCTSLALKTNDFYFGRNLDLECGFGEKVVVTPRRFPFVFRRAGEMKKHFAMIGTATVIEGYPHYAEAANEKGLCIAGLNFPNNAYYPPEEQADADKTHISPFELTAWLLGQCASVREARDILQNTQLVHIDFSEKVQLSPLHWHIADKKESIVLESTCEGMKIYDDPAGVLTNNPPFDFHLTNLRQYLNLTAAYPENRFSKEMELPPFGAGMGCMGLPGDFSPASRFVKIAFLKFNSIGDAGEEGSISRFFHLLDAVAMPDGVVATPRGEYERTAYSCCINADKGIFYYKTYTNNRLTAVDMHRENLTDDTLKTFETIRKQQILRAN